MSKKVPSKFDINLYKYKNLDTSFIYLDTKPRIRNIVNELREQHEWTWPPEPPKDFEKERLLKRRKWACLYSKLAVDICSILALIIGPCELLIALGFTILPKTFIPAMRESSEFCVLFVLIFLFLGFSHTLAGIIGLGLKSMRPYVIGYAFTTWPFALVMPLIGIFVTFVAFYSTEKWRIFNEMETHLKEYSYHWYSQASWDHYQSMMFCCGIENYTDWSHRSATLEIDGHIHSVPKSCCKDANCWKNPPNDETTYANGCLAPTLAGINAILVAAIICLAIAIFLSIMGHLSFHEAQDYTNDPIHNLIFESTKYENLKSHQLAIRREELFTMLNQYCIIAAKEFGLTESAENAKTYLGIDDKTLQSISNEGKSEDTKLQNNGIKPQKSKGYVKPKNVSSNDKAGLSNSKASAIEKYVPENLVSPFQRIVKPIEKTVLEVAEEGGALLSHSKDFIQSSVNNVAERGGHVLQNAKDAIETTTHNVVEQGGQVLQNTMDAIETTVNNVAEQGSQVLKNTKDFVETTAHTITEQGGHALNNAKDHLQSAAHDATEQGGQALQNTKEFIESTAHNVAEHGGHALHNAKDNLQSAAHDATEHGGHALHNAKDHLQSAAHNMAEKVHNAKDHLQSAAHKVAEKGAHALHNAKDHLHSAAHKVADHGGKDQIKSTGHNVAEHEQQSAPQSSKNNVPSTAHIHIKDVLDDDHIENAIETVAHHGNEHHDDNSSNSNSTK